MSFPGQNGFRLPLTISPQWHRPFPLASLGLANCVRARAAKGRVRWRVLWHGRLPPGQPQSPALSFVPYLFRESPVVKSFGGKN